MSALNDLIWGYLFGFGPGGTPGEVTPASVVTATGQMSDAQKAQTRTNLGAVSTSTMGAVYTRLEELEAAVTSTDVKDALLACFAHVAWTNEHGQDYYDALESALYPPADLVSISAVYTQSGTVYDTDSLDSLKDDLIVTATYQGGTSAVIPSADYTLSGTLTAGTSTITVTYREKTTTFSVTVTAAPTLTGITAVYTQSGTVYDTDSLDSLKSDLVVTAHYSDSTESIVPSADYTLSGTLTAGTSTITVSYSGKTTTFTLTVTESNPFSDATYERYPWVIYGNTTTPYADYIYKDNSTAARARLALPLANPNKTFSVTDSTKYNIAVYNVTSLETVKISVPGNTNADAWPGTDNNKSWGTSGSSSAPYVALSFKKMDNTEFTDEELNNMYGTVFTMA